MMPKNNNCVAIGKESCAYVDSTICLESILPLRNFYVFVFRYVPSFVVRADEALILSL